MTSQPWIIVTGGAGFIGSCLIQSLNEKGHHRILVVDNLKTGEKWKNLVGKTFETILPKEELFTWLEEKKRDIEAIFHLGACSDTTEKDADYLLANNYRYSIRLAEFALNHDIRFVYASSAATYGDGELGFVDNEAEIERLKPLNMYGYSKQLFDIWLKRHGGLEKAVGLKYFNVYGPNETHKNKMASFVCKAFPKVKRGESVELFASDRPEYGDGEQKRDFLYVKDAVRITLAFLKNNSGGLFNVGSSIPSTWNELTEAVFEATGKAPKIAFRPMPEELIGKYQYFSAADMTKLKKCLGKEAECQYSLKDGVSDYVKQYLLKDVGW